MTLLQKSHWTYAVAIHRKLTKLSVYLHYYTSISNTINVFNVRFIRRKLQRCKHYVTLGCFQQRIQTGSRAPIQWIPAALSPEVKRPGREDHSPPSSAEVKNEQSYTTTPLYVFMVWCLVTYRIRLHDVVLS
jgi:hypothetical protein